VKETDLVSTDGDVPDTVLVMCVVVRPVGRRQRSCVGRQIAATLWHIHMHAPHSQLNYHNTRDTQLHNIHNLTHKLLLLQRRTHV